MGTVCLLLFMHLSQRRKLLYPMPMQTVNTWHTEFSSIDISSTLHESHIKVVSLWFTDLLRSFISFTFIQIGVEDMSFIVCAFKVLVDWY